MPNPRSLHAYADIRAVLDSVLERGEPLAYELPTPAAAIRWRSRANSFRALSTVPTYKALVLSITKAAPSVVVITWQETGVLRTLDGEPVAVPEPAPEPTLEELDAQALAKELGVIL